MIVVDKPSGWTSHDVVGKLRGIAKDRRIGHLGTLDPSATGVLPCVLGRATRLAQFHTRNDKVYEGVIRFGFSTDSYDAQGEPTSEPREVSLSAEQAETLLAQFRGRILQKPPAISAKKIDGQPAYKLARKNKPVDLEPVEVEIFELRITAVEGCDVSVYVRCSGGTYIRSIAHDAGQALGCGAHLTSLRRLASGDFRIASSYTLEQLQRLSDEGRLQEALIPAAQLLPEFPTEVVDEITESQIRNGRTFRTSPFRTPPGTHHVKAVSQSGELVAIGEAKLPHLFQPIIVF